MKTIEESLAEINELALRGRPWQYEELSQELSILLTAVRHSMETSGVLSGMLSLSDRMDYLDDRNAKLQLILQGIEVSE